MSKKVFVGMSGGPGGNDPPTYVHSHIVLYRGTGIVERNRIFFSRAFCDPTYA